jgi:hypothetical protein
MSLPTILGEILGESPESGLWTLIFSDVWNFLCWGSRSGTGIPSSNRQAEEVK